MIPTPTALDGKCSGRNGELRDRLDYATERGATKTKSFPTPSTSGLDSGSGNCEKANKLFNEGVISDEDRRAFRGSGQLNPDWVEWLMGWPVGWTSMDSLDCADIRSWEIDPADIGEVPRVGKNIKNRVKRLKAIGNGQVSFVAAMAFLVLSDGLIEENQ